MRNIVIGAFLLAPVVGAPPAVRAHHPRTLVDLPDATNNDNIRSAGTLRGGVLTVRLYAAEAKWHPGPADAPPVVTALLGEDGHAPSNPGPLLRVPLGTRIDVTIRNAGKDTLLFV